MMLANYYCVSTTGVRYGRVRRAIEDDGVRLGILFASCSSGPGVCFVAGRRGRRGARELRVASGERSERSARRSERVCARCQFVAILFAERTSLCLSAQRRRRRRRSLWLAGRFRVHFLLACPRERRPAVGPLRGRRRRRRHTNVCERARAPLRIGRAPSARPTKCTHATVCLAKSRARNTRAPVRTLTRAHRSG